MKIRWIFAGGVVVLFAVMGCHAKPAAQPDAAWYTVVDKGGSAGLQFDQWVLVFEGVPSKGASVGSGGTINYPNPAGSGGSEVAVGDLKIKQLWNGTSNSIDVNGNSFTLSDGGRKLAFKDHSYQAGGRAKTIVIAKDGSTREMN